MRGLSVTARLALLAIALVLVSNFATVVLIRHQIHRDAIGALKRDTIEQSDELATVYRTGGLPALRQAIDDARDPGDRSLIVAVVDAAGRRLAGFGPRTLTASPLEPTVFGIGYVGARSPWSGREAGYAIRRIGPYWLANGRLLDDWEQEQRAIARAAGLSMLMALGLGLAAALVVTQYVGRRLDGMARVMDGVAAGDFARRAALIADGSDAFDRLAARMNGMLDKIERLVTELRVMTDTLAHDLRSPLARLRAKTEAALLAPDARAQEAALGGLIAETDVVMRMLGMLMEISRSEAMPRDRLVPTAPAALIEEIADLYAPVLDEARIRFTVAIDGRPAPRPLHRELLSQAISNLIDNAMRHAGSGGALTLRLAEAGGVLAIAVADRGSGIAAADRAEAIRRFGRLDRARSLPGAGLGLSLVDAVARLHGGRLELGDNAPGLIARIVLPAT